MDQVVSALLDAPALAPPPGVEPNFDNPTHLSQSSLAVLQLTAATVVVGMRVYTKLVVLGRMLAEDYWLVVAWVCFVGWHVVVFMFEALPMGVHQWDLTVRKAIEHARLFHIAVAIYCLVITPLKISLILQIRRIFLPHEHCTLHAPSFRLWLIDGFLALNILFYTALFLFQFIACHAILDDWTPLNGGACVTDELVVHIVSAAINTASDLIIIGLPQPVIWQLTLGRVRKWGLSAVFLLGGFACVASTIRLHRAVLFNSSADQTFHAVQMGKWAEPELTFEFLAACLPVLPAFSAHCRRVAVGCWGSRIEALPGRQEVKNIASEGQVETIGSSGRSRESRKEMVDGIANGRITRMLELDVEFEALTRDSAEGGGEWIMRCRESSRECGQDRRQDVGACV